jgi:FkbM family methyltransferase
VLASKLRTAVRVYAKEGPAIAWTLAIQNFNAAIRTLPGGLVRVGVQAFRPADAVVREWLLSGRYEAPERKAVKRYVDPGIPVIELGASIGVVSCVVNRRLDNPRRHVVVEANPALLPILEENRDRNRCQFEIIEGAAGMEGSEIVFYIGDDALCSSALSRSGKSVKVPAVTLGHILDDRSFPRCSLICDIEGAEIGLIHNELNTLRTRVKVFIVEFHAVTSGADKVAAAERLLTGNGFRLAWRETSVSVFENSTLC